MTAALVITIVILVAAVLYLCHLLEEARERNVGLSDAILSLHEYHVSQERVSAATLRTVSRQRDQWKDRQEVTLRRHRHAAARHADQLAVRDRAFEFVLGKLMVMDAREQRIRAFLADSGLVQHGAPHGVPIIAFRAADWVAMWKGEEPVSVVPSTVVANRTDREDQHS